jgi:hypothetical protein
VVQIGDSHTVVTDGGVVWRTIDVDLAGATIFFFQKSIKNKKVLTKLS